MEAPTSGRRDAALAGAPSRGQGRISTLTLAVSALAPACLAAMHVGNVADAAHDVGVARVLGLDAQPWRALDVAIGVLLVAVPVGTLATRAAMAGAVLIGWGGVVLYLVTRRLLAMCADTPRLGSMVAAIVTVSAFSAPAWQLEAAAVGGAVTGGMLGLLPVALLAHPHWTDEKRRAGAAVTLGLAAAHEPLVFACALGGCAAFVLANDGWRWLPTDGKTWRATGGFFLLGTAPLWLALARTRAPSVSLPMMLGDGWQGERGASTAGSPVGFIGTELGGLTAALAAGGVLLGMWVQRSRPLALALLAVVVVGFASAWAGAPMGPTRFGAPLLAAMLAACASAAVAIQAIVRTVASSRAPLARSAAAVVLVVTLVLPIEGAEETLARSLPRARGAAAIWGDIAWGTLPPRTVVLVTDRSLYARALAARASGSWRADIALVAAVGANVGRPDLARHALARDAALLPLWRDLEFTGAPTEQSLSSLASARPLAMAYEPAWGRALVRHLVPLNLFDRFAPEPRGTSDRRRGLDAWARARDRLVPAVAHDPELADAAARLLGARAQAFAASGDPDLVRRAIDDAHAFAPSTRQ